MGVDVTNPLSYHNHIMKKNLISMDYSLYDGGIRGYQVQGIFRRRCNVKNNTNDDVRFCPIGKNLYVMCHNANYATRDK